MPRTGKNIYKRKDGRWEGRYAKNRDSNGKIIYGSVYGKTCAEVKKRLAVAPILESINKPSSTYVPKIDLTFADVAGQWLSGVALKVKPSTYAGYKNTIDLHILTSFGTRKVQNITTLNINLFVKEKLETGRTDGKGGLSPKTVRDMLSIIKSIMDFAWDEKIIANRLSITYPKHQQQTIRVLSRQEQYSLETALITDTSIHKLGILLCLYTGLRVGEICALRWQDFSPEFDFLTVNQTLQRVKNFSDSGGKTKILVDGPKSLCSVRTIPIPTFLTPLLQAFTNSGQAYFLATDDAVYTEPRTMQNHFARIISAVDIPNTNYHALRHTFATRCIEAGVDVKSLSEMLGHANVNITLNRYVHSSFEQKREGMNKLERYVGNGF